MVAVFQWYIRPLWWRWQVAKAREACRVCTLPPGQVAFTFNGKEWRIFGAGSPSPADAPLQLLNVTFALDPVFVHQRTSKAGASRIIILGIENIPASYGKGFFTYKLLGNATAGDPVGLLAGDVLDVSSSTGNLLIRPYDGHPLTIFAGQADPKDNSHFTIEYERDGRRGVIDGYLEDNTKPAWAEYVRLIDRPGSKAPSTTLPMLVLPLTPLN